MKPGEIYKIKSNNDNVKDIKYLKFVNISKKENDFLFTFKAINKDSEKVDGSMTGGEIFQFIKDSSLEVASDSDKAKILLTNKGF